MAVAERVEKLLQDLTLAERAELLQHLAAELANAAIGIESTPGVCGGSACIAGTRIPVWILEGFRRDGMSEDELLESYPTLRRKDLSNAWAYVALHKEEIDRDIRENEEA